MSADRPKSFISPLQLNVGAIFIENLDQKMIKICSNVGFSCSYAEVKLYEISAAAQAERQLNPFI